jgi:hypothetical protein
MVQIPALPLSNCQLWVCVLSTPSTSISSFTSLGFVYLPHRELVHVKPQYPVTSADVSSYCSLDCEL